MDHLGAFSPAPRLLLPKPRFLLSADTLPLQAPAGAAPTGPATGGPDPGKAGSPRPSGRPVRAFKADDSLRSA